MRIFNRLMVLIPVLIFVFATGGRAVSVDIRHYDMSIKHDKPDSVFRITCEMNLYKDIGVDTLQFYFTPYATIDSVSFRLMDSNLIGLFRFEWRLLNVAVPPQLHDDSLISVVFKYTLPAPGFYDNFILEQHQSWYPQISNDPATFKIAAQVYPAYIAISNGDHPAVSDKGDVKEFIWESKTPVQKLTLLLAQSNLYETVMHKAGGSGVEIHFYSETVDEAQRHRIAEQAAAMMDYFNENLGDYSYRRLSIVETPNKAGGDVGAGLIFIGPDLIGQFLAGDYEELAAMVAMQWVGHGMYPVLRGPGAFFLGLSLPQHLKLMYLKHAIGETAFEHALQLLVEQYRTVEGHIDEPALLNIDLPRSDVKTKVLVGKGPYVCELLRQDIGEDKYFELLKGLYTDLKGRLFGYEDLAKYLIKIDPDSSGYIKLNKLMIETGLPK
mgnify:CR=1 FL=1